MTKTIKMQDTGWTVNCSRFPNLDMKNAEWRFFKSKFGKREQFTVHRGCLVVRYTTDAIMGRETVRRTATYLFGLSSESKNRITWNVDAGVDGIDSVAKAQRLIDRILDQGWYTYGLKQPAEAVK